MSMKTLAILASSVLWQPIEPPPQVPYARFTGTHEEVVTFLTLYLDMSCPHWIEHRTTIESVMAFMDDESKTEALVAISEPSQEHAYFVAATIARSE